MTHEERFEKIVGQYNEWMDEYILACDGGDREAASYYALMLNAVTKGITVSHDQKLKDRFYGNAANRHGVKYFYDPTNESIDWDDEGV
jgi:hypothetical protein